MTPRALPSLAALVAVGLAAALGAVVAERWRARLADRPSVDAPAEAPVLERPAYEPPPECEGDLPGSDMTYGTATLRLRLRVDPGGDPASMRIRLWRLDVPEDAAASAGDEMRATLDVPEDGVTIRRLPAGRYRVQCLDARNAPDPPEFDVADGVNECDVAVPVRRWFRLRVQVVDERGDLVRRSMRCDGGGPGLSSDWDDEPPRWATPRRPKSGQPPPAKFHAGTLGDAIPKKVGPIVSIDDDGFLFVGRFRETRRGGYWRRSWCFRTESRADVVVGCGWGGEPGVDSTLVGVAPSIRALLAHVILPNGEGADPSGTKVDAWSWAWPYPCDAPADAWRTIRVNVKVTVPRCEPLEFIWTAANADEEHALVPLPPWMTR